MAVVDYYTMSGEIIAENSSVSGRRDYLPDALGSVQSTVAAGSVENTYSYKPYGLRLFRAGVGADPIFTWVGSLGYQTSGRPYCGAYARARNLSNETCRWSSVDPLWPTEPPYAYPADPITGVDPSGMCLNPLVCADASRGFRDPQTTPKHFIPPVKISWGNYCGGDWRHNPIIEFPKRGWPVPAPLNDDGGADACCAQHDREYIKDNCNGWWNESKKCCRHDKELCECLKSHPCKMNPPHSTREAECARFRFWAITFFCHDKPLHLKPCWLLK